VQGRLSRRELLKLGVKTALAASLPLELASASHSFHAPKRALPTTLPLEDDVFLDDLERATYAYFWEQASSISGHIKDRASAKGNDKRTVASIAATGFGLTAHCIAHRRGYRLHHAIEQRVRKTLRFLLQQPHVRGFFYHFIDMDAGYRSWNCELSSIDTAILLCGVLTCRQYFQDKEIRTLASRLYERVDWPWMLNGGTTFSMGWTPEAGFLTPRWDTYSELMMLYLLAIGSRTNPVPASTWNAFERPKLSYEGLTYITNVNAPLFIHQYSQAWFDFRKKHDAYADYFENSITATKANKLFCLSLQSKYNDYQENAWGISASDSIRGYTAWGGPPRMRRIDGSLVPCATGGSLPFLPDECIAVLRNLKSEYPRCWQRYGFVDAFNPLIDWYDHDVIGIDAGIMMVMAENLRSGFVWDTFMKNPEARKAFAAVGFESDGA
jgi:hypothetical protein